MDAFAYGAPFEHTAFVWDPIFYDHQSRRVRFYALESKIAVEEAVTFNTSTPLTSQVVVERFLDYGCDGDRERYLYRNLQIENFLKGLNLDDLCHGGISDVDNPLVLLDDRRSSDQASTAMIDRHESYRRTLSAHELYKNLRDSRYNPLPDAGLIFADRRTIYITDVNPYCMLALLATSSPLQVAALRDFIWRNLTFHAFLGVRISAKGFKTFALEFHLPYYAWRPLDQDAKNALHLVTTGRTHQIRKSQGVKYLHKSQGRPAKSNMQEQVFEAQLSILVTGIHNRFWTAYSIADVYFKGPDCSETAEYYHQANEDPHSGGKDAANQTIWDAREFFLRILACRMEQVREEWDNVISQLLNNIEPYADRIFVENSDTISSGNHDMTQDESFKWTIRVLRKYTNHLSKTISRWETFKNGEIRYFFKPNSNVLAEPIFGIHLAAVNRDVEELIVLRKSLEHQTEMFENMTNSMATHAALAENRTLRRQSDFIQALTVITIFYLPLNLASSIFSMQSTILPELVQLTDYIYTLLGLTVATLILVINLPHIMKFWQVLRKIQSHFWRWVLKAPRTSVRRLFSMKTLRGQVQEQDLEMQNGNTLQTVLQEEV